MKPREYTEEEIQALEDITLSCTDIYRKFNIPASTVRRWRQKHGMDRPGEMIVFKDHMKNEFVRVYDELKYQYKVAEYFGCSSNTVHDFALQIGYVEPCRKKLSQDTIDAIIDLYNVDSASNVAKMMNLNPNTVSGVWFRYGLRGKTNRTYRLLNEHFFENENQNVSYWLGFIAADGCIYTPKNTRQDILSFILQRQDEQILEILRQDIQTNKPIAHTDKKTSTGKKCEYSALQISSNIICNDIRKFGLENRKTYKNTIANVSDKNMWHFIRGYIDGDGSIYNDGNVLIVGYQSNMIKIKQFCEKYNIFSSFHFDKRKNYNENIYGDPFGQLSFNNKTSGYCLLKMIYDNCGNHYLKRKKDIADKFINYIETSDLSRDKQIVIYYQNAVLSLR